MPYEIIRGPVELYTGSRKKSPSPTLPSAVNEKSTYSKVQKKKNIQNNGDFQPVYLSEKGFMDDVLNLKIYKLPTSLTNTFLKPNGQKVLLGENIINAVTSSQLISSKKSRTTILKDKEINNEEKKTEMTEKIDFRNSLLYKFLLSKKKIKDYRSDTLADDDEVCLDRIKISNNRANQFKSGRDLTSELQYRTLQETLDWAVDYVRLNETQLAKDLQVLVDEMKSFMDKRKLKSRMSNVSTPNVDARYRDAGEASARNSANKSDSETDLNDVQASQQPTAVPAPTNTTTAAPAPAAIPHPPVTPSGHLSLRKVTIKKTDGNVPKLSLSEKLKRIEKLSSKRNDMSAGVAGRGSGGGGTSREGRSRMSTNDAAYRDEEEDPNEDHFGGVNIIGAETPSPAFGENIMSGIESSRNVDSRTNLHSNNSNRASTRMTTPRGEQQTPSSTSNTRKPTSSSPNEERNTGGKSMIRKQKDGVENPHRRKFMKPSLKIEVKRSPTSDNDENDFEARQSRDSVEILKCPSDCISAKRQVSPTNLHNPVAVRALTAPSSPTPRSSPPLPTAAAAPPLHPLPISPPRTGRRPTTTTTTRPTPIAHSQSSDNDLTSNVTNHPGRPDASSMLTAVAAALPTSTSPCETFPPAAAAAIRSPRSSARRVRGESLGGGGGWASNNNNNNNNSDNLTENLPPNVTEGFTPKTPASPRMVRMHLPLRRLSSADKPGPATPLLRKRPKTNEATRYSSNSNTVEFLRKSAVLQYGNDKSQPEEVNALKLLMQKGNGYIDDMGKSISILKNKQIKVNSDGNRMLKRIDQFFESQIIYANKTRSVFDTKEYHRPELLKEKFDKWLSLELESSKQSHLELDAKKDMQSLEEHVQRKHYRQSMENLMKASWFAPCFTKLQEVAQRNGQPIPKSCLKFLSVLQCIFMVGREFTPELFYYVMEHTVAREDHILLGVYKTLKYALDAVNITPDSFLDYLEERGIQPCAEHLANIRKLRKLGRLKLAAAGRNANIGSANVSPTGSGLGSRIRFNDIEQPRPKSKRASNLELIYEDDEPYESGESSRLSGDIEEEEDEQEMIDYDL